jgi:hypothetical protein
MDTFPVGREFGSLDYERLTDEDAVTFSVEMLAWIKVSKDSINREELSDAIRDFADDIRNIQKAMLRLGHDVSYETAAAVWIHYSQALCAGWMSGAESMESAATALYLNCPRVNP